MRVDPVIRNVDRAIRMLLDSVQNKLTAGENFGPEGTAGQVLTSNGPDRPPTYQPLPADIPEEGVNLPDSYTIGDTLYASDPAVLSALPIGVQNEVLTVDGGVPAWAKIVDDNVATAAAIGWSKINKAGSSLVDLTTRSATDLTSGNLNYLRLPTGGGVWANAGALSITGGVTTVAGLISTSTGVFGDAVTITNPVDQASGLTLQQAAGASSPRLFFYNTTSGAGTAAMLRQVAASTLSLALTGTPGVASGSAVYEWNVAAYYPIGAQTLGTAGSRWGAAWVAALTATTGTFSGAISATTGIFTGLGINGAAGTSRDLTFQTAASNRWTIRANGTAEGGANAGTNLNIMAWDDAGAFIDTPISITRAAGASITLARQVTALVGITINNGLADGGDLSLLSQGFATWNIDNSNGVARIYSGAVEYFKFSTTALTPAPGGILQLGVTGNRWGAAWVAALTATTGTFSGAVSAVSVIGVSDAAGTVRDISWRTAGVVRWGIRASSTAEGGANAGSNLQINAYDDAGANIDTPVSIIRVAGGAITLARPVAISGGNSLTFSGGTVTALMSPNGATNFYLTTTSAHPLVLGYNTFAQTFSLGTTSSLSTAFTVTGLVTANAGILVPGTVNPNVTFGGFTSTDVGLRKESATRLGIVSGDNSTYADVTMRAMAATTGSFSSTLTVAALTSNGDITINSATQAQIFFTKTGANAGTVEFYNSGVTAGFYDNTNARTVWTYTQAANTLAISQATTFSSTGVFTGLLTASAGVTSNFYNLNGVLALDKSGNYTRLSDDTGTARIYMGNVTDPTNYYDNGAHVFRSRAGGVWVTINNTGTTFVSPITPASANTSGLGTAALYFANLYTQLATINGAATVGGLLTASGGITTGAAATPISMVNDRFVVRNIAGDPRLDLETGAVDLQLRRIDDGVVMTVNATTGVTTFGYATTVSGLLTASAGVLLGTASSPGAGSIFKFDGLNLHSATGSVYDFALFGPAGAAIMRVPTATVNVVFAGNISAGGITGTSGTFSSGLTLTGATVTGTPTWTSNQAITLSTASQPNVTTMSALTTIGTLVAGTVPAARISAGTFQSGAFVFAGAVSGITTALTLASGAKLSFNDFFKLSGGVSTGVLDFQDGAGSTIARMNTTEFTCFTGGSMSLGLTTARWGTAWVTAINNSGAITMTAAASQIIGGATSLSLRNSANTLDNLLVLDTGEIRIRDASVHKLGTKNWLAGDANNIYMYTGPTSFIIRNSGDSANVWAITTAGVVTMTTPPAFVAADKYLVISAAGVIHKSALGPAS